MQSSAIMRRFIGRMLTRAWFLVGLAAVAPAFGSGGRAAGIADAYINQRGNVVVVATNGRETVVTSKGGCERIEVAKDHRTVAWSKPTKRGSAVFLYRDGVVKKIEGDPFIGGFWFVDGGRWIAIESGGMHFAGWELLYDVATLKRLAEFNQSTTPATNRPYWSSNTYKDED
jgi:hypothetical protein